MEKFRTGGFRSLIESVEIERETDTNVWINGRRSSKSTNYHKFFNTWDEAKAALVAKAERDLSNAKRTVDRARSTLEAMKALKP